MQVTANFIGLAVSAAAAAYLKWVPKKRSFKSELPSSALPDVIQETLNETFVSNGVPWSTIVGVVRSRLVCRSGANCVPGSAAYAIVLPKVYRPGASPDAWDRTLTTWQLSTQSMMRTGYPLNYPVATMVVVPPDTPSNVIKIVDTAIVPMITASGSTLNMGPNWQSTVNGLGLDITGNSAHAFVVKNNAGHEVYFAKVPEAEITDDTEYWSIPVGSKVLLWQDVPYWPEGTGRTWKAFLLPSLTDDQAAYIAEAMMYDYLGNERPTI